MPDLVLTSVVGLVGVLTWSFAEYAIHNWYGHLGKGKNEFSRQHLAHHANPMYFAPTSKKIGAAIAVLAVLLPVAMLLTGVLLGLVFGASMMVTYTAYEVLHRRIHTHPPRGPYGRWARKYHLHHHFTAPKLNHGVTSSLWDHVFGTHCPSGVVRVPERHAMPWLRDPDTGEVKAEFADDYVISRPGQRARAA